ncbi:MAG: restriction endonuclease subunit S [Acetatifactor sp.]
MEEIQLKDICDLDNGYAFKSDDYVDNSNTLNCRMSNIRPDGSFDILYSAKYLPDEFAEKYKDYILHDGDLIIAMTDMAGDPKILGVPTVVDTQGFCLLLNQRVGRLRFIRDGVNADYLKLALQCPKVRTYLKRFAGGGVQLNVSKKDILSAPVCMRNEEEQNHIAGLFKRVLEVKTKREQELQLLDDLIKARFVELFGDLANPKCSWKKCKLIEACADKDDIRCGPFGTQLSKDEYTDTGVAVWEIPQINSAFVMKPVHFLTEKKAEELNAYTIISGDIAMSRKGNVGKCAVFPDDYPDGIIHSDVLRIRVDSKKVNSIFMMCQLHYSREVTRQIEMVSSGAIMAGINVTKLKQIYVHIPPMELQNQFADFVHQVDKSKFGD